MQLKVFKVNTRNGYLNKVTRDLGIIQKYLFLLHSVTLLFLNYKHQVYQSKRDKKKLCSQTHTLGIYKW